MITGLEIPAVVAERDDIADGVARLVLTAPGGGELPSWRAGSHITLLLENGLERQYSLCGPSLARGAWEIAVRREDDGRGGSAWVQDNLHPGVSLSVRGPDNHFALGRAPRYEFVAGGIGITPLLSMIAVVHAQGADWRLRYAGRSLATMPFAAELRERHPEHVELYAGDAGERLDLPGTFGSPREDGTQVYACGPLRMLEELETVMAGWPDALHVERFAPVETREPVWNAPFDVELLLTGGTITVTPEESLLEAAERAGALVVSSCREGTCGTCETIVTDGDVDHRDGVLSPSERARGDRMMICVSRAACPRLTLEL